MQKTASPFPPLEKGQLTLSFNLNDLQIGIITDSQALIDNANDEFVRDWNAFQKALTKEIDDFQIRLQLVEKLPPLPDQTPLYQGNEQRLIDGVGTLSVYETAEGYLFDFLNSGRVHLTKQAQIIHGIFTTNLLTYHRLYDLIFTSLSSFLRQKGYYLIHGSAVVYEGNASIFVGTLRSAKSTTALNLALNGWGILSDDTLLLQKRPDGIYALPTPGGFSIRPQSIQHIPDLAAFAPSPLPSSAFQLSPHKLNLTWADPAPVSAVYFPTIVNQGENEYQPLPSALTLAHLLELSLDRWDTHSLPAHISFLEKLSRQAKAATLKNHQPTAPPPITTPKKQSLKQKSDSHFHSARLIQYPKPK